MNRFHRIVAAILIPILMANSVSSFEFRVSGSDLTRNAKHETRNVVFDVVALALPEAAASQTEAFSKATPKIDEQIAGESRSPQPAAPRSISEQELLRMGVPNSMATRWDELTIRLVQEFSHVFDPYFEQVFAVWGRLLGHFETNSQTAEPIFESLSRDLRYLNPANVIRTSLRAAERGPDLPGLYPLDHMFGNLKVVLEGTLMHAWDPIGFSPAPEDLQEISQIISAIQTFINFIRAPTSARLSEERAA